MNPWLYSLSMMAAILFSVWPSAFAAQIDFGVGQNHFSIDFVAIGNPGNSADMTGVPNPAGSVPYEYRMGKYEVSRDMVDKANASGNLGITLFDMTDYGANGPNKPATGVSWNEAARFVNWLNTSQGFTPAYKFQSQPGDLQYNPNEDIQLWQVGESGYNPANRFRNTLAQYFLPSVDEWYKAAYFDPQFSGGAGGYWNFPTGSNLPPSPVASGIIPATAVYMQPFSQGPADVMQAGGLSPYGVMGLAGNVVEWQETEKDLINDNGPSDRMARGGHWYESPNNFDELAVWAYWSVGPSTDDCCRQIGFRVASVPEPQGQWLASLGAFVALWMRRYRACYILPS